MTPRLSLMLMAAVLAGGPRWEQAPSPADYHALIDAYRAGQSAALDRIGAASEAEVQAWIDAARPDRGERWDVENLRAAAVAHTELWSRGLTDQRPGADRHLHAATRLFERVRDADARQADFVDRWRRIVLEWLSRLGSAGQLEAFFERTTRTLPTAPQRVEAERAFREGLEAERHAVAQGFRMPFAMAPRDDEKTRWLARAGAAFGEALERDATHAMAALHLGRTRLLQGKPVEAARYFSKVLDAPDPRIRYLALLFLGSLAERDGRTAEAERAYADAQRAYPLGQAAVMALSQLFSRLGQEARAREVLAVLAERRRSVEPLWTYVPPGRRDVIDLAMALDELRAEVRK